MREQLEKYADEIVQDRLGGIFGVKRGDEKGPTVMVAGHMDEVGFMVTQYYRKWYDSVSNPWRLVESSFARAARPDHNGSRSGRWCDRFDSTSFIAMMHSETSRWISKI